ncbi:ThiF family adenylyltransferase [Longispora sp. K20-0274]|uniref:HesA/MoeB/ThiF family protein n=1 Tax=Longispora sp. K20-0274 TaxID=3088255 RepID=UPI00399B1CC4
MRPMLKPVDEYRVGDTLRLVRELGVWFDLDDGDGGVAALLGQLDGTRTVGEISASLGTDAAPAIAALDGVGLLEDADAAHNLTAEDHERYASNLAFLSTFASLTTSRYALHSRLRDSRVVLLGVGGLGSTLLLSLAGAGVGHLTLLDVDRVELRNLTRQFLYTEADVGRPKVYRAAARALAVNPTLDVRTVERLVTGPEDVTPLLDDADLVLCGVDRPRRVRHWVSRACVAAGVPFLSGGMTVTKGVYFGFTPGRDGCMECWEAHAGPLDDTRVRPPVNRAMGPMAAVVGGLVGVEALRVLTGFAPPVSMGRVWTVDFVTGEATVFDEWARRDDCPVCGLAAVPR